MKNWIFKNYLFLFHKDISGIESRIGIKGEEVSKSKIHAPPTNPFIIHRELLLRELQGFSNFFLILITFDQALRQIPL